MTNTTDLASGRTAMDHVAFVMQHPRMTRWIKNAVREAMDEDPIRS